MTTIRVTVQGETFTVEVQDPQARPVVALVDGERFEIWPEAEPTGASASSSVARPSAKRPLGVTGRDPADAASAPPPLAHPSNGQSASAQAVLAPLPGVVAAISVQPGDVVAVGQELLAIEAMKMKNVVRAVRAGAIARVHVAPGQSVQHKQVLVEYE